MKTKKKPVHTATKPAGERDVAQAQGNLSRKIQAKLSVGAVNDPLEHEADAVAERVVRMPEIIPQNLNKGDSIQRQCADCSEEEKVQRKEMPSFMQSKATMDGSETLDSGIAEAGSGQPMSDAVRSFMESRFETDFSNVRIHTDPKAAILTKELSAEAFAVGRDVFFNEGRYSPENETGKRLLAHELTHTIQQENVPKSIQKQPAKNDPVSGWESDDESFAKRLTDNYLLTEHNVIDAVKKVERLAPPMATTRECLVTTEGGLKIKVLWSTDTNKAIAKACVGSSCKACAYDYAATAEGNLTLSLIRCWTIAGI
jgi:hypothetical protein